MRRFITMNNKNSQHIRHPLQAIYSKSSKILILGTMASPKSREVGFFYGNPQNRFWKVLAKLFDEQEALTNEARTALLLRHHIALWDVLASCTIEGASDASISHATPNDLSIILDTANIQAVFTTGTKAFQLFQRFNILPPEIDLIPLPSTSPANARMHLDDLVDVYSVILHYLDRR